MFTHKDAFMSFSVPDLDKAAEFYTDTLQLTVKRLPEGLNLQEAERTLAFIYYSTSNAPASFTVLNFIVENIEESINFLASQGIIMEKYDTPELKTNERGIVHNSDEVGPHAVAWFKDPFGNILSIIQL